ncbi:DUF4276 family protein [Hyalangium versicolor]|uniref:DUF4276 family protein n=1 Tax=Hyalangium versicolor TaxID=2861190 RepID=UPI001CCA324B|nr:DUF4276 family protein [Hyalangium versicolor]
MKVGLIVEGHGEERSVPLLLRRVLQELEPALHPDLLPAYRVSQGKLVKREEFERALELMARRVGSDGRILVLLDADDDLPCVLGPRLLDWARSYRPDRDTSVVVAKHEYEAWFLTAAASLRGKRGLPEDLDPPATPESIRDAKGWLHHRMQDGYSETLDQPALTGVFDLRAARLSDSFDKFFREVGRLFGVSVPPRGP